MTGCGFLLGICFVWHLPASLGRCADTRLINDNNVQSDNKPELPPATLPQPIEVSGQAHWRAQIMTKQMIRAAPLDFMPDGTQVKYEKNEFGEAMPRVPEIVRPKCTLRQSTKAPGTCRWNPITASWISLNQNSSRGTWGCFKDRKKQSTKQSSKGVRDGTKVRGFIGSEVGPAQAKLNKDKSRHQPIPTSTVQPSRKSGEVKEQTQPTLNKKILTIEDLRGLAAAGENESAMESVSSCGSFQPPTTWYSRCRGPELHP